jgi:hypothetical protein
MLQTNDPKIASDPIDPATRAGVLLKPFRKSGTTTPLSKNPISGKIKIKSGKFEFNIFNSARFGYFQS